MSDTTTSTAPPLWTPSRCLVFECHAITDIWTAGGTLLNHKPINDRLRLTSLLGGIRWWAEAVVRGFGVRACDPVSMPCKKTTLQGSCLICQLFGSADPALSAKFALRAWKDAKRQELFTGPPLAGSEVFLEFYFYRAPKMYEQYLLIKTLNLITLLGSIGGRTTRKPTRLNTVRMGDTGWRDRHTDYGLLRIKGIDNASADIWESRKKAFEEALKEKASKDPDVHKTLPALTNFWFAPTSTLFVHPSAPAIDDSINNVLGLRDTAQASEDIMIGLRNDTLDSLRAHLRGLPDSWGDNARSKRVFSFGSMGNNVNTRTWGYVLTPNLLPSLQALLERVGIPKHYKGTTVLHMKLADPG